MGTVSIEAEQFSPHTTRNGIVPGSDHIQPPYNATRPEQIWLRSIRSGAELFSLFHTVPYGSLPSFLRC